MLDFVGCRLVFYGDFMSSGRFVTRGYATDAGVIHPIRIQPESAGGANDSLTPIAAGVPFFRRGGSRRKFGNFARFVTLGTPVGAANATTPFAQTRVYAKLTVFAKDVFDNLAIGAAYTYQGVSFEVVSKTGERVV